MSFRTFDDLFNRWLVETPDGRPFRPLPWDTFGVDDATALPFYLRPYDPPTSLLSVLLILALAGAVLFASPVLAGISAGLLALIVLAAKDSWIKSGALAISAGNGLFQVHEHQPFQVRLQVANHGDREVSFAYALIRFTGLKPIKKYFTLPPVPAGQSIGWALDFRADSGMGPLQVEEIHLVTVDTFGLFPRCVTHPVFCRIEVLPDVTPMPHLRTRVSGRTSHAGTIEARKSGDSTSFLALREFRFGDSIRRIDWKRTARFQQLMVRDFERLDSTDATIFIDNRQSGLFDFENINSFDHLKDSVLSLCRTLIEQRIRIQMFVGEKHLPFGGGMAYLDEIAAFVSDIRPDGVQLWEDFLTSNRGHVPPDSLVVPVFCAAEVNMWALQEIFIGWEQIRSQVIPVVIDAHRFEQQIRKDAESFSQQPFKLDFYHQLANEEDNSLRHKKNALNMLANAIVIAPGETIGQVYARMHPWQR